MVSSRPAGRPISIEKVHHSMPAADGHIPPVGIDRQKRRVRRRGPLNLDVEIGVEQKQPRVIAVAQQGDQRTVVADGTRRDPVRNPRERQRFPLSIQQVKLISLVPGENPTRLTREGEPFERRLGHHRPARLRLQLGRRFFTHPGHWPVRPALILLVAPQVAHATDRRLPWRERQDIAGSAVCRCKKGYWLYTWVLSRMNEITLHDRGRRSSPMVRLFVRGILRMHRNVLFVVLVYLLAGCGDGGGGKTRVYASQ